MSVGVDAGPLGIAFANSISTVDRAFGQSLSRRRRPMVCQPRYSYPPVFFQVVRALKIPGIKTIADI